MTSRVSRWTFTLKRFSRMACSIGPCIIALLGVPATVASIVYRSEKIQLGPPSIAVPDSPTALIACARPSAYRTYAQPMNAATGWQFSAIRPGESLVPPPRAPRSAHGLIDTASHAGVASGAGTLWPPSRGAMNAAEASVARSRVRRRIANRCCAIVIECGDDGTQPPGNRNGAPEVRKIDGQTSCTNAQTLNATAITGHRAQRAGSASFSVVVVRLPVAPAGVRLRLVMCDHVSPHRSAFRMLSDMLWSGTFQNRQSTTGGISATRARTVQLDNEVRFATSPIAMMARIQPPAAIDFECWSCMMSTAYRCDRGTLFKSEHAVTQARAAIDVVIQC